MVNRCFYTKHNGLFKIRNGGLAEVSTEIKTLIAGTASMITLGHPGMYFD